MNKTEKIGLLPLLIVLLSGPARAQENLWNKLNSESIMLYKQGQYPEAAKSAEKALKTAEKTFGPKHPEQPGGAL
jgi:hypothetical protein